MRTVGLLFLVGILVYDAAQTAAAPAGAHAGKQGYYAKAPAADSLLAAIPGGM